MNATKGAPRAILFHMHEPKHILIVEDDHVLSAMLRQLLEAEQFRVTVAEDGEVGMKLAAEMHPDFLVVDIDMPKLNGIIMLKALRGQGVKSPAIMLTNLSRPEYIAEAAELGILEYLIKADWEIDKIVAKIKGHLTPRS